MARGLPSILLNVVVEPPYQADRPRHARDTEAGSAWPSTAASDRGLRRPVELITAFCDKIAELRPQLVTFNGNSFDLPVLRYRAMVHGVSAPGLSARPYFHRYSEDAIDLCDVFSSFSPQGKATLHEISRVMGLPGKPKGIDGGEVERYFREGKIKEIAEYCETDVVGTYQVWLRYELFRGTLSQGAFEASERKLAEFMKRKANG